MTLAHIAGLPFEEWLGPLLATGGGITYVLRAVVVPRHPRHPRTSPSSQD